MYIERDWPESQKLLLAHSFVQSKRTHIFMVRIFCKWDTSQVRICYDLSHLSTHMLWFVPYFVLEMGSNMRTQTKVNNMRTVKYAYCIWSYEYAYDVTCPLCFVPLLSHFFQICPIMSEIYNIIVSNINYRSKINNSCPCRQLPV